MRQRPIAAALTIAVVASSALLVGAPGPAGAAPGWPADPGWQEYVQSPSSTDVHPVAVVATTGDVQNAGALLHPGSGQTATLTATPQTIKASPVSVAIPTTQARYVRVDVTKLGLPAAGDPAGRYVQLAELQVFGATGGPNLAAGRTVTSSDAFEVAGWSPKYLTDGVTDTQNPAATGFTSHAHPSDDVSGAPIWVTVDLGSVQTVSSVTLWPRTDTLSPDQRTASFPVDFSVQTATTEASGYQVGTTVTGQPVPAVPVLEGSASVILDYGKEVGGYPTSDVSAASGEPTMRSGYSETRTQLSATGDGITPWASGDSQRFDDYTVTKPGRITNSEIQGGQRYQQITLTSPGTVSLSSAGLDFTPYLATPDTYRGHFLSSSEELNKLWYAGAYTVQMNQTPTGSIGPRWNVDQGVLDVPGGSDDAGLLKAGAGWGDYTVTFDTKIVANQAGWVVRGQDPSSGYLMILDAADDTIAGGGPNVLQQVSMKAGTYQTIKNVPLPEPLESGTWHTVKEVVTGGTVTTSIDGTQVASFDSAAFPAGTHAFASGSFGFRQSRGEEASYRNLKVVSGATTLYDNPLGSASALADFAIPGKNQLPLLLDGAKRDRAVWSGDLAVEGPALFYSTNASDYMRGSIELLGSWTGSNGYAPGSMPPQTPLGTPLTGTTRGGYSATYSMYFVRDLAEYYLYTGDAAFVRQEWPIVAEELDWSASQVDAHGLFATTNDTGADWDYYDGNKTGEVTAYNALYHQTLLDGAELAAVVGQPSLASTYTDRAAALRTAINDRLFDAAKGVYVLSDTEPDVLAQDANALAITYGVAPQEKVAGILAAIKAGLWTPHGTRPYSGGRSPIISPFVSGFELNARFGAGGTDDALQLLSNEWGPMIAPGDLYTGTFWENLSADGTQGSASTSMAHGWSAMPTASLSKYVLGIQPVDAGYATWLVQPHPGDLAWVTGQADTPHGALVTKWSHDAAASQFAMQVTAPGGTSGTVAVPTFGRPVDVTVNGQKVWSNGAFVANTAGVQAASLQGEYVDLAVGAGTFDVASGPPSPAVPPTPTKPNAGTSARNDHQRTGPHRSVKIAVLENDTDADGDALSVVAVTRPDHGKARVKGTKVVYTPQRGYAGRDRFTYTVSDGRGGVTRAKVKVVVRRR